MGEILGIGVACGIPVGVDGRCEYVCFIGKYYGRGAGVGRGLGVGEVRGVAVAAAVGVTVGVAVAVAVAVDVGVGVGPAPAAQYLPPVLDIPIPGPLPPQTIISPPVHTAE